MTIIRDAIETVVAGGSLSADEAARAMGEIMSGDATPAQIGALAAAMRMKGETVDEIAGMARAMREKSLRVRADGVVVDTCGTGGDSSGSYNISTTAALIAAGAGVKIAKHGNRAMSGATGSADVLEALGVKIALAPESVARCLDEVGFGFMFAQGYHPAMRFAAAPRREIGVRTVFNLLGPLTNPAGAARQVIGVSDPNAAPKMAGALALLGSEKALVVHGADGMDELTITGPSAVHLLEGGNVSRFEISPSDLGLSEAGAESVRADGPEDSARIARGVLEGERGAARDVALMNAAAALVAADAAADLADGVKTAARAIDEGAAAATLANLAALSRELE